MFYAELIVSSLVVISEINYCYNNLEQDNSILTTFITARPIRCTYINFASDTHIYSENRDVNIFIKKNTNQLFTHYNISLKVTKLYITI